MLSSDRRDESAFHPSSPDQTRQPMGDISLPTQSNASFSSQETIKASKLNAKAVLKELVGGGGNNRSVTKLPKSERVYTSGRGGARKGPKSPAHIGPSNAEKLNALLANSKHTHDPESLPPETATVSSFATSYTGSSNSAYSTATVKRAVREVLGGGGNEHGLWRHESEFTPSYGRGGSYRSPAASSFNSRVPSEIEILSEACSDDSSLSVARNSHGLFFFGRGTRASEDASDAGPFLIVGPGEGIFHPRFNDEIRSNPLPIGPALTRSSLHRSGMSKISVKVAVKQVLGGGGNDDGEWKYIDVFYPGYGRGGEGARCSSIRDLYDIFYPYPHYSGKHHWYHLPHKHLRARQDSNSTISFPSISSDSSSVYAPSMSSGNSWVSSDDEDGDAYSTGSRTREYQARPGDHLARWADHDLVTSAHAFGGRSDQQPPGRDWLQARNHDRDSLGAGFPEESKERTKSESYDGIHSLGLIDFKQTLQEERRRRGEMQLVERSSRFQGETLDPVRRITPKRSVEALTSRSAPPPPSRQPPSLPPPTSIRYSYNGAYQEHDHRRFNVLPIQFASSRQPSGKVEAVTMCSDLNAVEPSLASALALVYARSDCIMALQRNSAFPASLARLELEREELRLERELLAVQLQNLKKEILQREKTIEGLTWLMSNLPEHEGMEIVVHTEEGEIDEKTMSMIREAEEVLVNGDSRSILDLVGDPPSEELALSDRSQLVPQAL
ncbi:hypothetical protein FRB90_008389 [Tulasnella sp. 427]|nr:hypothetical protein FRB90_008389 [Tulasnella sp. 427]